MEQAKHITECPIWRVTESVLSVSIGTDKVAGSTEHKEVVVGYFSGTRQNVEKHLKQKGKREVNFTEIKITIVDDKLVTDVEVMLRDYREAKEALQRVGVPT